ncbi:RluA family pseudouridine synthase [Chondromyces apiculatus]|uniref:Pseudouridine synthase n=1 Tax=Chondromyces apiculatus DSM 436 TaxID=1192034 RepID=A0A017TI65_9BACT|nr:RluA family pseudouridine synthase [Chondromyces apiculatus]EYF08949.1 Ribosomal large subunit pseudouridine synthase D [Chondromyces apiculatus DSM 436]
MTSERHDLGETLVFEVTTETPRERLDKLLVHLLATLGRTASRATVQRWIDEGRVLVNGSVSRGSAAVPAGARVEVHPPAPARSPAAADKSVVVPVVFEDEHLLVIDKPAGMVVHPARGHEAGTMINGLLARPSSSLAAADPRDPVGHLRPGIVHRLDKGTSGVLVVAKDAPTREALKELFASHAVDREYLAIVVGEARDATYDTLHGRHPTDRLRFSSHVHTGRRAVTHARVLERFGALATLVACTLETGRTHQIRIHLAERGGTPVLADPLYGKRPRHPQVRTAAEELGRQALHARMLGFVHPRTGVTMRWESPLPADMERALNRLRALATTSSISRGSST